MKEQTIEERKRKEEKGSGAKKDGNWNEVIIDSIRKLYVSWGRNTATGFELGIW